MPANDDMEISIGPVGKLVEDLQRDVAAQLGPKELEPMNDTVVFRAVEIAKTDAGLYIPQKGANAEARQKAIVVAVGPGRLREDGTREPMPFAPGDWIVVWKEAPPIAGVDHTGETLYLVRAEHIAARVVPKRGAS